MHILLYKDEKAGKFTIGDEEYEFNFKNNSINIKLPFDVNIDELQKQLEGRGCFLDEELDETDTVSWGHDFDFEGYYPYTVFKDKGEWYFSFPPEDYNVEMAEDGFRYNPALGREALKKFKKWLPLLEKSRK